MIGFFRRIRKKLADDNQFLKYIRYAIGEILLVVIGILIALGINNQNEKRNQKENFKIYIEQMYSLLKEDLITLNDFKANFELENKITDTLLTLPESIDKNRLTPLLFFISWGKVEPDDFVIPSSLPNFEIRLDNNIQKSLQLRVKRFIFQIIQHRDIDDHILANYLTESHNIPSPEFGIRDNVLNGGNFELGYYSDEEIHLVADLVKTKEVKRMLKNVHAGKQIMINDLEHHIQIAQGLINTIERNYPNIKLVFGEMGILGSSFESGWDKSMPLEPDKAISNIWNAKLYLNKGEVKFRTNNNWVQNWGGDTFPAGEVKYNSLNNIRVEKEGLYLITLDLNNNTYKFELINK